MSYDGEIIEIENETKMKNLKVGDEIYFGTNKRQKMIWKVLKIQDSKALVITTKNVVRKMNYHKRGRITWSDCTLRKWLNSEFVNGHFNQAERDRILSCELYNDDNPNYGTPGGAPTTDKVFLLSIDEANTLFVDDQARASDDSWWLRSPGNHPDCAAYVSDGGTISTSGNGVGGEIGVRPTLWLNFKADLDTETIAITYNGVEVKATVHVKGDDRILSGISLFSCPYLEKTADRAWKIVEGKMIPDAIRDFNNGEVRFGDANRYFEEAKYLWNYLSNHEIALITPESADHLSELKKKSGYTNKDSKPTAKFLKEIEMHIMKDGFSFEDTVGEVLRFWNSFASLDRSLFISILETYPRKKDGSLMKDRVVYLPISSAHRFYFRNGLSFNEKLKFKINDMKIYFYSEKIIY